MPDEGPRCEAESESGIMQPPAEIHIISRSVKLRIKAADRIECISGDCQIATRQMLGLHIIKHHVARRARRGANHRLAP